MTAELVNATSHTIASLLIELPLGIEISTQFRSAGRRQRTSLTISSVFGPTFQRHLNQSIHRVAQRFKFVQRGNKRFKLMTARLIYATPPDDVIPVPPFV